MSRPSVNADEFIPSLSQHEVDGENSHPNIHSNHLSRPTCDASVNEPHTQPDDHIVSYRRFELQQEKTRRPNGNGFLRNTKFDFRCDSGYKFVTNVICDILNDANIKVLKLNHVPPTFIQDLVVRTVRKEILIQNKQQLERIYDLMGIENVTSFYNYILDLYFKDSSITCRMYISDGFLVYDSKIAPFFNMSSLRATSDNSCKEALDKLLSFIFQYITGFRDDMVVCRDNVCWVPSTSYMYTRVASNSAINTDSLMRRVIIEKHYDPQLFVWRRRPNDEEYHAMTLSICAILNNKYVTQIPKCLLRQLSDRIVNGDIPIWNLDQLKTLKKLGWSCKDEQITLTSISNNKSKRNEDGSLFLQYTIRRKHRLEFQDSYVRNQRVLK